MDVNEELKFLLKKIQKKGGVGGGSGVSGRGRVGGGVSVDVNEELKFFVKIQKKNFFGGVGSGGGSEWM